MFDGEKEDALLGEGSFGKTFRMRSTVDGQARSYPLHLTEMSRSKPSE